MILLFEDNIPAIATNGGHVATLALIDFLKQRDHVYVVNVLSNKALFELRKAKEGEDVARFERDEKRVNQKIKTLTSRYPKMVTEIDWQLLRMQLETTIKEADKIIFGTARFLHLLRFPEFQDKPTYYIADNVEYQLALAMLSNYRTPRLGKLDAGRIRRLEKTGIARVTKAAAFTENDQTSLALLSGRPVELVPPILPPAGRPPQKREPFALYPTNLNHPPNVEAMDWLLSEVWNQKHADWKLVVTGAGDFSALAQAHPDIDFRGFVSREELDNLYDRTAVVINPTRSGSGFQIKLLEALSYGCPVVSTSFSNPLGDNIPHSDSPVKFAALVDACFEESPKAFDYESFYKETEKALLSFLDMD